MAKVWVADDLPSRRYPLYTRGNVGEVFPTVVSPLTWSLYGPEAEGGWRQAFCRFGATTPGDYGDEAMVILGVFGGYCYINVTVTRIFAVRAPGLTVADIDRQLFGESDAPPYHRAAGDRSLAASVRVAGTLARTLTARALPELDDDKGDVDRWIASLPDVATATDAQLVAVLRSFRPRFRRLFEHHILTTFQAMVGPGLVAKLCVERLARPELVNVLLAGIGSVESAEPSFALWSLGRLVASDPALTAQFDAGLDGLAGRLDEDPAARRFNVRFADFVARFGFRGPNEWEGSSPTWATDPPLALAAVDRMRLADPAHDPARQHRILEEARESALATVRRLLRAVARPLFDRAVRSARLYSQGRERSKTTVIRAMHAVRLAQLELARRGRDRGGAPALEDFWLLQDSELEDYLEKPELFAEDLDHRRAQRDLLRSLVPPFVFEGTQPPVETWARRDAEPAGSVTVGTELRGIAGCPGTARGRARIVLDPGEPDGIGPGDVLVAPITDPSWTPLFVPVEAVIVDVGAQMSHAVIVSRELGIPAVVSVTDATRLIPDGALVEVDGTAGVVRILELP